jgi:hypothetical protein
MLVLGVAVPRFNVGEELGAYRTRMFSLVHASGTLNVQWRCVW